LTAQQGGREREVPAISTPLWLTKYPSRYLRRQKNETPKKETDGGEARKDIRRNAMDNEKQTSYSIRVKQTLPHSLTASQSHIHRFAILTFIWLLFDSVSIEKDGPSHCLLLSPPICQRLQPTGRERRRIKSERKARTNTHARTHPKETDKERKKERMNEKETHRERKRERGTCSFRFVALQKKVRRVVQGKRQEKREGGGESSLFSLLLHPTLCIVHVCMCMCVCECPH